MWGWIVFGLLHIPILMIVATKMYIWYCYHPPSLLTNLYFPWLMIRLVSYTITAWTFTMFYFLLCITGYWFIFYKLQTKIYVFLPDKSELWILYTYYKFAFWIVSVGMLYYVGLQIYD